VTWNRRHPADVSADRSSSSPQARFEPDGSPDRLSICAGTLDPPTFLRTVEAWWTSEASDYHTRPLLKEFDTE